MMNKLTEVVKIKTGLIKELLSLLTYIMRIRFSILFLISILFFNYCSTEEPISTSGFIASPALQGGIIIESLSTKPWLVTGGDVLVEITAREGVDSDSLQIDLNGEDVAALFVDVAPQKKQAVLEGLQIGDNLLTVSESGGRKLESLTLTNYLISGPIISGPHEQPFHCQTEQFRLVNGELLGEPLDSNCMVDTRIDYVYWSDIEGIYKAWRSEFEVIPPADLGYIPNYKGDVVPFIVRVETGTVNRAVYEIAMLHESVGEALSPWSTSQHWNGKLIYTHGGGCRSGWYQQGNRTGGVMRRGFFEQGYAVVSSTLNVFGQNCNDLLASETHIMVKERFTESYGKPVYTIATGASGGSYQSHQTADNYPGIFDGIIVGASFPDVTTATIFTVADARLLNYYFNETNPESFTIEQQRAISGFGVWDSIPNLARGAARLDPIYLLDSLSEEQGGEVSIPSLETAQYNSSNPRGPRATVYDHTVNVYGKVSGSTAARRPLDNVGVQYGLRALNEGAITPEQFIDLNRGIGGFDRDMNHIPERHRGDIQAVRRALESGRILNGGAGLSKTPIIDYRTYLDHDEGGNIHMLIHQFSTRERLLSANGGADNHVMQIGGIWNFDTEAQKFGELYREMDRWLTAINSDTRDIDSTVKVVENRPESLSDACWDNTGEIPVKIIESQTFNGSNSCNELYPSYLTPRHVAGAPLANNIVRCVLRPISPADYGVGFTPSQYEELGGIFPEGVCDWSQGDETEATLQGTWVSFGPSPVNRLYRD